MSRKPRPRPADPFAPFSREFVMHPAHWPAEPTEAEQAQALRDAAETMSREHPLPRCKHGHALRDHAGDTLEPSCGCRGLAAAVKP